MAYLTSFHGPPALYSVLASRPCGFTSLRLVPSCKNRRRFWVVALKSRERGILKIRDSCVKGLENFVPDIYCTQTTFGWGELVEVMINLARWDHAHDFEPTNSTNICLAMDLMSGCLLRSKFLPCLLCLSYLVLIQMSNMFFVCYVCRPNFPP